ncbi:MAG: type II toxin-antitoxin system YafQ family toxin [Moraxellaceae bacterium]|nr:type II toxin-antitoxin system YafQ family toxin [Pseudomonadales bacterium]MCP5173959.1 type II toxin-antitoxin system YafQ family toxin [Moraxellaceae bacterium]
MLTIKVKKQFKKDLKKALLDPKRNTNLLKTLIDEHLVHTGTVPSEYLPHPLVGSWKPHMECHIQPDFLLIWDVDWQAKHLILVRCGSHSELF